MNTFDDTIIAISTPLGFGGLGVIRLSGDESSAIAAKLFKPGGRGGSIPNRRPVLGRLIDPESGAAFEQAVLTFYPAPHSYTTEDLIEISTHGSPVVLEEVIRLGLQLGARLAEPGEFTLRAFSKGRMDLIQAQAVNDLIRAPSLRQARISFRQMEGGLSRRLQSLRRRLVRLLSQMEAGIEFPEEEVTLPRERIRRTLKRTGKLVAALVESYNIGRSLTDGITLSINGRANVGKSTLFNALLERDRAIVTPGPGTTRDYLREPCLIGDTRFSLIDTAGLDTPSNPAEKEGIRRSRELAGAADGILLVIDASRREVHEDINWIRAFQKTPVLLIFNKADLPQKINRERVIEQCGGRPAVDVSALQGTHLNTLKRLILETFAKTETADRDIILHLHQKMLLEAVGRALAGAERALLENQPDEIVVEEMRAALDPAGRLLGEIHPDDVLKDIFKSFCIGK